MRAGYLPTVWAPNAFHIFLCGASCGSLQTTFPTLPCGRLPVRFCKWWTTGRQEERKKTLPQILLAPTPLKKKSAAPASCFLWTCLISHAEPFRGTIASHFLLADRNTNLLIYLRGVSTTCAGPLLSATGLQKCHLFPLVLQLRVANFFLQLQLPG